MQVDDRALERAIAAYRDALGADCAEIYAAKTRHGDALHVFRTGAMPSDHIVVTTLRPNASAASERLDTSLWQYRCDQDAALPGIAAALERFDAVQVLRYRPGKRATLAARTKAGTAVIVKCFADQRGAAIFRAMRAVYVCRDELTFDVAEPITWDAERRQLVQSVVGAVAEPVPAARFSLVGHLVPALRSLHASAVRFEACFGLEDQALRTQRYVEQIASRLPSLGGLAHELLLRLGAMTSRFDGRPLAPIHGSLHSHQCLPGTSRLAIVDFDRAAMGHAELDVATFLAEWDYEAPQLGHEIERAMATGLPSLNWPLTSWYRAHKHVAKAFKAAKQTNLEVAQSKAERNLLRTRNVIAEIDG